MTSPSPSLTTQPAGVRIAGILCWLVGVLTIVAAVAIGVPAISTGAGIPFIAINVVAGVLACVAGWQIRKQRKIGVLAMLVAWAIPTVAALAQGLPVRGSLALFVALVLAAANWKHFR